ncbi:MAG: inositol monophosphatase family protein [Actinomycetota bacterium]
MSNFAWEAELEFALELAAAADEISMKYFTKAPQTWTKADGSLVTVADREVETMIRERIEHQYPNHAILGEEHGLAGDPSGPIWIIDPIDGTNNYATGVPIFATLIALRVDGVSKVGVASAPALAERYEAAEGSGARMNGLAIQVSAQGELAAAAVAVGSYRRMARYGYEEQLNRIFDGCRRDRGFGDFWGHMLVARGSIEVMMEPNLNIWDIAALEVIVREAGGVITTFKGAPYPESRMFGGSEEASLLTTNGLLHEQILAALSDSTPVP